MCNIEYPCVNYCITELLSFITAFYTKRILVSTVQQSLFSNYSLRSDLRNSAVLNWIVQTGEGIEQLICFGFSSRQYSSHSSSIYSAALFAIKN